MADGDDSEKTEQPTQKRLNEALKKGQVASSREVGSFLMLLILTLNIIWFAPIFMSKVATSLSRFIHSPHDILLNQEVLPSLLTETVVDIAVLFMLPILATVLAALLASFLQNGIVISGEPLMPKLEKISIAKGIKRMFSLKSMMEFFKGIFKIILVATVSWVVVSPYIPVLQNLPNYDMDSILQVLATLAFKVAMGATILMFLIALLDFSYQKFEYIKSLKMSKQEIKDEYKQSEGDPMIKGRLRQIRMQRARNRMMTKVPDADVVIRNPTHFAIALQYNEDTMAAPVVLAMGQDNIALKIIEIADENKVPTVRNPPLARALFDSATIDQQIPFEHFAAVAEVISYVYKTYGKKS